MISGHFFRCTFDVTSICDPLYLGAVKNQDL